MRYSIPSFLLAAALAGAPLAADGQTPKPTEADRALARARAQGAADADITLFLANRDPRVQPYYRALFVEGERNAVLNFNRVALIELEQHHVALAQSMFNQAATRIETIYANDPNAEKARSTWNEESVKDFKGEPYERAMTFYYRGLTWLLDGDYDNAHANFKRAEEQTMLSEAEHYNKSSFAAITYLQGWSSHCAGNEDLAEQEYRLATGENPVLKIPAKGDDLVLISEVGIGPTKSSEGEYNERLRMVAGSLGSNATDFSLPPDPALNVMPAAPQGNFTGDVPALDPMAVTPVSYRGILASNISEQSTMRDGRPVDVVLAGKAQFKSTASAVGEVGTTMGTSLMEQAIAQNDTDMAGLGAGLAIFGMIASASADAANPAADKRYWDTLPGGINIATGRLPKGVDSAKVHGSAMTVVRGQACSVAWAFERDGVGAPSSAPNADPDRKLDSRRLQKDAQFRAGLLNDFLAQPVPVPAPPPVASPAPASPAPTPINATLPAP